MFGRALHVFRRVSPGKGPASITRSCELKVTLRRFRHARAEEDLCRHPGAQRDKPFAFWHDIIRQAARTSMPTTARRSSIAGAKQFEIADSCDVALPSLHETGSARRGRQGKAARTAFDSRDT